MPSQADVAFEHEAILALCGHLTENGRISHVTSWPDLDPTTSLTVDALAMVGGVKTVIEHCRLTTQSAFPPALRDALAALTEIARETRHPIHLSILPPSGGKASERQAYYASALKLARSAARLGPGTYPLGTDAFTVAIVGAPTGENATDPIATISSFTGDGGHPGLSGQLLRAMGGAWTHKLEAQLPPAKAVGCAIILLLDVIPAPDQQVPPHFLAFPATVAEAIQPLLDQHPGIVDEIWLREANRTFARVPVRTCFVLEPQEPSGPAPRPSPASG